MLTNNLLLPDPVYQAIANDPYDAGDCDISVTRLIAPPRVVALTKAHREAIVEDASDRLWATFGQLMHLLLERSGNPERYMTEDRMFIKMLGWTISGQFDLYDRQTGELSDYKFVGAFAYKMAVKGDKPEWEWQLNLLRYMLFKERGILAKSLSITCLLRDYTKRMKDVLPVGIISYPVWTVNQAEEFMGARIREHQEAQKGNLPLCTDEDRWLRSGVFIRCESYCGARDFCSQAGARLLP